MPAAAQSVSLPALGDGAEMSTSAERALGDRIARMLYRDPAFLDDAILGDYVQGIWGRLMQAARQRGELSPELEDRFAWEVLLGRDRSVNAFALPGGYMGVHLGLIAVVSSEDELASVLAHELSHVTQRHIVRMIDRQSTQAPWMLGAMILGALAAASNPSAAGAMIVGGQAAAVQGQLNFSRDMEREADRVGYGVMTQAGFDGRGFVGMFEKLQQANRFNDTGAFPYLRSHPLTTERMADMQGRQQLLPTSPPPPMSLTHAMLAARARQLANPDVDSQRATYAQLEVQAFRSLSEPRQVGALYAGVMAAQSLRDFELARRWQALLAARVADDPPAAYQARLLAAELALAQSQGREALDLLAPDARSAAEKTPRAVLFLRARAAAQSGRAGEMAEGLQLWLSGRPRDAQAWQLLALCYTALGQPLRAVRAEAEAYAARLDYAAARDRLKAAQDLARRGPVVDHIEASIIDARSRQIDSMLREQALER
ncbi:MAG: M48 family metalloprotease [Curvibacter sp.]|jgi:predicted Zn-dependent protease|nr:M48 family metalloprotease [Curvibacter sp.]